jgi:transcriptional regulator with XRE-family HTH domain
MKKEVLSLRSLMGKRFKTLRENLNLTQKEMAIKMGIPVTTISTIEMKRQLPTITLIHSLIDNFGVSPFWFLKGEGGMFLKVNDLGMNKLDHFKKAFPDVPADPDVIHLIESMAVPIIKNAMIVKALELKSTYKSHILEYEKEKAQGIIG